MRIAVIGAGGVGGYFGARLAAGGSDVVFAVRGAQRDALATAGLRVRSGLGDLHIEKPALLDADSGTFDVVLLCTKLWGLAAAAEGLRPLLGESTGVVPLQNGVDAEDIIAGILGPAHVIGGVAYIAGDIEAPGVVRHTGTMARLAFGERDGRDSDRVEALRAACEAAGIDCKASRDINKDIWTKFVMLSALSGATALFRATVGEVLADGDRAAVHAALIDETLAVASASGIGLADDLGEKLLAQSRGLPFEMKSSLLVDLERGNPLELDWLSGAVVRKGRELGIATPQHAKVVEALAPYKSGA